MHRLVASWGRPAARQQCLGLSWGAELWSCCCRPCLNWHSIKQQHAQALRFQAVRADAEASFQGQNNSSLLIRSSCWEKRCFIRFSSSDVCSPSYERLCQSAKSFSSAFIELGRSLLLCRMLCQTQENQRGLSLIFAGIL